MNWYARWRCHGAACFLLPVILGHEILVRRQVRRTAAVCLGVGLLHGLGFASILAEFGMPDDAFATALIAFNVGVELGQLTVILAAYLAVGAWLGRKPYYRQLVVMPGSVMITVVGLYWAWERLSL